MKWIKFSERRPPVIGNKTIIRVSEDFPGWGEFFPIDKGRIIAPQKNTWYKNRVAVHEFHTGRTDGKKTIIPYSVLEWLDEEEVKTHLTKKKIDQN